MLRLASIGLLLSGCYIVSPGGGSGGDDDPPPPPDDGGGSGPVGRQFSIQRGLTSPSCSDFAQENLAYTIDVTATDVIVDGSFAANAEVRSSPASEANFDSPNVNFSINEFWTASEGSAAVQVNYIIWVSGPFVTGDIHANFEFLGSFCSYTWRVVT